MTDPLLQELLQARASRRGCALVTLAATQGSVPRAAGAKMLVYADGRFSGTIGGGKFEALVIDEARAAMQRREKLPVLKTYPLHEGDAESFGAICGGTVTVLIEPQVLPEALVIVGGGHCSVAIARLAQSCGWQVTILEDREDLPGETEASQITQPAPDFIAARPWQPDEALVMVSRNYHLDREALAAALQYRGWGYCGMIGSRKKVRQVFAELGERGFGPEDFAAVHAPIGLDIGADSPAEIAISVLAEVLRVLRGAKGGSLRLGG
ncbi:MAG: XdhC family protein [Chthoniobacteraceae bacterium]